MVYFGTRSRSCITSDAVGSRSCKTSDGSKFLRIPLRRIRRATPLGISRGPHLCGGVTLIELLIVVAVLAILLGTVLTMMRPVMKEMRVREAARLLNAFLAGAQARAAELGRPVAVYIEPYDRDQNRRVAFQVFHAESPPPYAGDTTAAVATIGDNATSASLSGASLLTALNVGEGDLIRFDYKGHFYEITTASVGSVTFKTDSTKGIESPPPTGSTGVPYQIFRKPIKTVSSPLDIPEPLAIDIKNSGMGLSEQFDIGQGDPIIISFAPSGGIHRVYGQVEESDQQAHKPTDAVHLLIGWADKAPGPPDTVESNLDDGSTRWVSVGHVTGRITTTENKAGDNAPLTPTTISEAREWAAEAQGMGSGI
jgi:prepilin-type N-terminal cleavage/methylation domain-containing protein